MRISLFNIKTSGKAYNKLILSYKKKKKVL